MIRRATSTEPRRPPRSAFGSSARSPSQVSSLGPPRRAVGLWQRAPTAHSVAGMGRRFFAIAVCLVMAVAACGDSDDGSGAGDGSLAGTTITVYSGRGEDLIQPVFDLFELQKTHSPPSVPADRSALGRR